MLILLTRFTKIQQFLKDNGILKDIIHLVAKLDHHVILNKWHSPILKTKTPVILFTKQMLLKWESNVTSKRKSTANKDLLGFMETKFNMEEVIMLETQISFSTGHQHLFISIKTAKKWKCLSKIQPTRRDAIKYLNKTLKIRNSIKVLTMLMRLIDSINSLKKMPKRISTDSDFNYVNFWKYKF